MLDRSLYSDFVFAEAMFEAGYMSKQSKQLHVKIKTLFNFSLIFSLFSTCFSFTFAVKNYYEEQLTSIKIMLKRPHLVIYLDVPVNIVQKRIKERNRDWEVNSPVLTEKYLSTIDRCYKQKFLKEMRLVIVVHLSMELNAFSTS